MDFLLPYTVIEFTTGQKWTKIDGTVKSCALLCNKYNDVISYKTITRHNFFSWTKMDKNLWYKKIVPNNASFYVFESIYQCILGNNNLELTLKLRAVRMHSFVRRVKSY